MREGCFVQGDSGRLRTGRATSHRPISQGKIGPIGTFVANRKGLDSVFGRPMVRFEAASRAMLWFGIMRIDVVTTLEELLPLRDPWNALAGDNPFLSWEWMAGWWQGYGHGHHLSVITMTNDDHQVVGIAPLYRSSGLHGGTLRFIGSYYTASDYLCVLARPSDRGEVHGGLLRYLAEAMNPSSPQESFGRLELDGVAIDDVAMQDLSHEFLTAGYGLRKELIENTWRIALPASWQTFCDTLGYGCRRKARKAEKRLDSGEFVLKTTQSVQDFDRIAATFADLHQRRRMQLGQSGCFSDPRFNRFFRCVMQSLSALGKARLQWIEWRGEPVAAQFQLLNDSTVYMFQSGMDPNACKVEAGHAMTAASVRHAIAEGYQTYDLLRGDEPYKAYWSAQPRPLCRYHFTAPLFRAKLVDAVCQGFVQAKRLAKSVLSFPLLDGSPSGSLFTARNTAP